MRPGKAVGHRERELAMGGAPQRKDQKRRKDQRKQCPQATGSQSRDQPSAKQHEAEIVLRQVSEAVHGIVILVTLRGDGVRGTRIAKISPARARFAPYAAAFSATS